MQNKRDQLHAYRFTVGRMVSALVHGEPDAPETPLRRSKTGTVIGAILGVLALAGFWVYGLIVGGGNTAWREPGTIIVEKETGTRYLFLDGVLRPVSNYTSARLALGAARPAVRQVSRASLAGVPHGNRIGIPKAPDTLPEPRGLHTGAWNVCAAPIREADGRTRPGVQVVLDDLPAAQRLPGTRGGVVESTDGAMYLLWQDQRFRVPDRNTLIALGYGSAESVRVDAAWVNALRVGPDLRAKPPEGRGEPGPLMGVHPSKVGQVLVVDVGVQDRNYFLVRRDGLSPLTRMDAVLHLADPGVAAAYQGLEVRPIAVTPAAVANAPQSPVSSATREYPVDLLPTELPLTAEQRILCVRIAFSQSSAAGELVTIDAGQIDLPAAAVPKSDDDAPRTADEVLIRPGGGVLVTAVAGPGVPAGALYLITDSGLKYPIPSAEVLQTLGYEGVAGVPVPTAVLGFLPTGPPLDPASARAEESR